MAIPSDHCHVSHQISVHCDQDDEQQCPVCGSANIDEDHGKQGMFFWYDITCHDCGFSEGSDNFDDNY